MSVGSVWDLSSDAELITAVRSGEAVAFGVLYERHSVAAHSVARQYTNSAADAEDAVQDAFSRVFAAIQSGGGPDVAFRAYLFTVLRRVALSRVESVRRAEPTDDLATFEAVSIAEESSEEPAMEGFERGVVSQAYSSLPERWQAVLWYTEVENLSAAEIAPILGLTANGVAALAYRAREGLRQAYLQQHLAAPASEACTLVNSKLGAYVRGGLAKRETLLVESHLEECRQCRAVVLELGDVNHGMRAVVAPLVLGGVAVAIVEGIGFGGAVAAAKGVGLAAGAAAGGAGGTGGTGGEGGAGASPGAGAGGQGVGAGAGAAGGGTSGTATGAGAAATAGAGGAGATGGFAAVVAAIAGAPAAFATIVALVVIGASLGLAGVLGLFSGTAGSPAATVAAEGPSDAPTDSASPSPSSDSDEDGSTDDGVAEDGTTEDGTTGDGTTEDGTPGGGSTDGSASGGGSTEDGTSEDGSTDGSGADASDPPSGTDPSVPPSPEAVPVLAIGPVGDIALVAGVPTTVDLVVRNDSDTSTGLVSTTITFDAGTQWTVSATSGAPAATRGTSVATARTGWSCAATSATTATCTLPSLAAHSSSVLHARIAVTDDALDGNRDVNIAISTAAAGGPRTNYRIVAKLSSPPAYLQIGEVESATVRGKIDTDVSGVLRFPVRNDGGTTATGVTVRVVRPADLPSAVVLNVDSPNWTCTPDAQDLVCTTPVLARRASTELPVRVTVPAVTGAADPVVDIDATSQVQVLAAGVARVGEVRVVSAPARLAIDLDDPVSVDAGVDEIVTATVRNVGGTTITGLKADVDVPHGATLAAAADGDWSCGVDQHALGEHGSCDLNSLAPVTDSALTIGMRAADTAEGDVTILVRASYVSTVSAAATLDVRAPSLEFSQPLTAELIEGGLGTVSLAVSNAGRGTATDVTATVELPSGTEFVSGSAQSASSASTDWQCSIAARTAVCSRDTLPAGEAAALLLDVVANGAVGGTATVGVTASNTSTTLTGSAPVQVSSSGLSVRGRWEGGYDATWIGAPTLGCVECGQTMTSRSNVANNSRVMVPVASVAALEHADVEFAGLYWSGNRHVASGYGSTDAWSSSLTEVTVVAPDGTQTVVTGSRIADATDNGNREYYQSFADVTEVVNAGGVGAWRVDDVAYALDRGDSSPSYYAGWTMVVVYADQSAGDVTLYDGGAWVASGSEVTFAFNSDESRDAVFGATAWDGDQGNTNDHVDLDAQRLTPLYADGTPGSANDAFNSTAYGASIAGQPVLNSLGVDAKVFEQVELAPGLNRLTFSTVGDQYLIGAVTVATAQH